VTTRSASCGRQRFARLVSALAVCGTAALLCPPVSEALGPSRGPARTLLDGGRTTTIAPLSCTGRLDGIAFATDGSASAALPKAEPPRLPFSLQSITAANESPAPRGVVGRHDTRGPPACGAAPSRAGDDRDDENDDCASDASRASLRSESRNPVYGSTTCRLLHRSGNQHSDRAPPQ
jgi:hypothetical protein